MTVKKCILAHNAFYAIEANNVKTQLSKIRKSESKLTSVVHTGRKLLTSVFWTLFDFILDSTLSLPIFVKNENLLSFDNNTKGKQVNFWTKLVYSIFL